MNNMYNIQKLLIGLLTLAFTIQFKMAKSQNENIEFNICYGESVTIPPDPIPSTVPLWQISNDVDQGPQYVLAVGPPPYGFPDHGYPVINYSCPFYDSITVVPNVQWPFLNPTVSTEYTVTYQISNDEYCKSSYVRKIKVNVSCSAKNNPIVQDYPWLVALTDRDDCAFTSIDVYEKNGFTYLKLNSTDEKVLYYENGSLLCSDNLNYDCVKAFQLNNKTKSWSCDQTDTENPIEETPSTFNTYTWLSNFVNPESCNNESVYVYDADTYEFLIIKTNLGESIYTTNGELICFSPTGGFSFIGLYNESRILDSWHCEQGFQSRESKPIIQNQDIQIFPNPAKDNLFINLQQLTFVLPVISIYDVQGKQVMQTSSLDAFAGIVQLDVSVLVRGIYLVEVKTKDIIITEKLLIK